MERKTFNSRKRVLDSSGYESDVEQCFLTGPPRNRRRRDRTHFTESDLERLETAFIQDRYPDINVRESLAFELGVSEDRIHVWFQNRRSKSRRRQKRQQMTSSQGNQIQQPHVHAAKISLPANPATPLNPWGSSLPLITPLTTGAFSPAFAFPMHINTGHLNLSLPVTSPTVPTEEQDQEAKLTAPPSENSDKPTTTVTPPGECRERNQVGHQDVIKVEPGSSSLFKRPWETPSPESQSYRRTRSDQYSTPIMYPSRPFVFPPMLPFSPLGTPGNGCIFLPHAMPAPFPFVLPELPNMN